MAKISVALYYKAEPGKSKEVREQIIALKEKGDKNIVSAAEVKDPLGFTGFVRIDAEDIEEYHKAKARIMKVNNIIKTNEISFTDRFIELSRSASI